MEDTRGGGSTHRDKLLLSLAKLFTLNAHVAQGLIDRNTSISAIEDRSGISASNVVYGA